MSKEKNKNKKKNRNRLYSIAIILLLLLFIFGKGCENRNKEEIPDIDPGTKDAEDINDEKETNEQDNVAIMGLSKIEISENCNKVVLNYINPEQNDGKYYLCISIILKENDELIYQSGLIPPGQGLAEIEINRTFSKGSYPAILHVQPYKMNDYSTTNNADLEMLIIVN